MAPKAYSLNGSLYAAPVNSTGLTTGTIRRIGNAYPLKLTVTSKIKSQISKEHDRQGQTIDSTSSLESVIAELVLRQLDVRSWAWAVAGGITIKDVEAGTVEEEAATALDVGEYFKFDHKNITNLTITNDAGDVEYVQGVDYIAVESLGMVTFTEAGAVKAGDDFKYSYSYAADNGNQIAIGTQPLIQVRIWGTLVDEYSGETVTIDLYLVTITSPDGINLIAELDSDYEELNLTLTLNTPTGATTPGVIDGLSL